VRSFLGGTVHARFHRWAFGHDSMMVWSFRSHNLPYLILLADVNFCSFGFLPRRSIPMLFTFCVAFHRPFGGSGDIKCLIIWLSILRTVSRRCRFRFLFGHVLTRSPAAEICRSSPSEPITSISLIVILIGLIDWSGDALLFVFWCHACAFLQICFSLPDRCHRMLCHRLH